MRVIIAIWSDGRVECYSTLTGFLKFNPGRNYATIMYHVQRLKNDMYQDAEVTLYRRTVIRQKLKTGTYAG